MCLTPKRATRDESPKYYNERGPREEKTDGNKVQNVSKSFFITRNVETRALRDVSLEIKPEDDSRNGAFRRRKKHSASHPWTYG